MRTALRSNFKLLFVIMGLLLALPAAVWADATLDTSADLSTSVATPSNVGIGDNTFKIKVWAFQGNVPNTKNGEVNVGTKYNMSTTGAITADTSSIQKVDFSNINYGQCPTSGTIPQGCPGNPFEVTATLNVASGTANGKTGTLTVYHAPVTDSGLTADAAPATGQVKVVIPDSTPPVITSNVTPAAPNGNGWYKDDVSVSWTVTDAESAITSKSAACDATTNITQDTTASGQTVSCTAASAGGTDTKSVTIKLDKTPPTDVVFNGGPNANTSYAFGSVPAAPTCDANFDVSGKASCDITGYSTAVSAPNSHTMTATATDNAGNVATQTRSYTVTKAQQATLVLHAPSEMTFGQAAETLTTDGGSGDGAVSYSVGTSNGCSVNGDQLTVTNASGTCHVTATKAESNNFLSKDSATATVELNKAQQATLTLNAPASMTFGQAAATLTTDGGSGDGAVSYSVGTSTGCSVSGNQLTVTNASGTCHVTATKAESNNFLSKDSATATVELNKAQQATLVLHAPSEMTFGQAAETLTTDGGSGDGAVTYSVGTSNGCSVSGDQLTVTNASGTCNVTATKAASDNYESTTSESQTVNLHKAQQATLVLHAPSEMTFGDPAETLTTDGGSGDGAVSYSVGTSTGCSVSGNQLTVTNASGTCHVTATKAESNNFLSKDSATATVELNKAQQATLTLNAPASMTFGQAAATLTTDGGSGDGAVSYSVGTSTGCSVSGNQLTVTNASGTCHVTATKAESNNFLSKDSATATVELNKASQTINFVGPTTKILGAPDFQVSATGGASGNPVTFTATGPCTVAKDATSGEWMVHMTDLGTCAIKASQAGNDNYNAATDVERKFNITAKFSGILQPVNADGTSRFKTGSTIPVKFQLRDYNDALISNAVAKLAVNQSDTKPDAGFDEGISTSAATTGNLFRYDATSGQYIFNLSTKIGYTNPTGTTPPSVGSFSQGTWTLWILLPGDQSIPVKIQLVR